MYYNLLATLFLLHFIPSISDNYFWNSVDLPLSHIPCYMFNNPSSIELCKKEDSCPYKEFLNKTICWGYEDNCTSDIRYSNPRCSDSSMGWTNSKKEQKEKFFKQADFGYIKERQLELTELCEPYLNGASLKCAKYMRFCQARNIMFDFSSLLTLKEPIRYREDIINEGQIGGYCKLYKKKLNSENQHKSPLQSWFAELEHFTEFQHCPFLSNSCDIIINKPTFIMKLDASINMYHHFCDFLNLYATLHLNNTFTTDINILIWDTVPYRSNFVETWNAFTKNPLLDLKPFKGKKVCFRDVVFPLLPRMIFGMYYNMPLIPGCSGSGLFKAFAEHIRHKLQVEIKKPENKLRIVIISRDTKFRRILNEDELISALETLPNVQIKKVKFDHNMPFVQQLQISCNTDILIGIHGAGLTHMLFMPPWGTVFELFNCDDQLCYADLSRLAGLNYITWERKELAFAEDEGHHPTLGAHAKFTNYAFDVDEFLRLVKKAINYVQNKIPLDQEDSEAKTIQNIHIEL